MATKTSSSPISIEPSAASSAPGARLEPVSQAEPTGAGSSEANTASQESLLDSSELGIASSTRAELIRQAAYRRYQERGAVGGCAVQDWLDAEAEINQSMPE